MQTSKLLAGRIRADEKLSFGHWPAERTFQPLL